MPVSRLNTLIHRIFENAFNLGDFAAVDELLAPDSITHMTAWRLANNRTGLKQFIASFRLAFPDLNCTIIDEIYEGNKLAMYWILNGTQRGPFLGNQPTGRPVRVEGMIFARTLNGQISEGWLLIDQFAILQQLGIVPPPGHSIGQDD